MGYVCSVFYTPSPAELQAPIYFTWVGHRICKRDHVIGPRVLPNYKAVLVTGGSGFVRVNGRDHLVRAEDLFFLFPNVVHHYYANPEDPWTLKWIAFNGTSCADIMVRLAVNPQQPILHRCMTHELLDAVDGVIAGAQAHQPFALSAMSSLYWFFDEIMRIRRNESATIPDVLPDTELIQKVISFVALNYTQTVNVDILCRHINYSRSSFSHLFKKHMGCSLPDYTNQIRLEKAVELLVRTDLSNAEIAMSIGLRDPLYFSRLFKRKYGISPQKYRLERREAPVKNKER